MQLLVKTFFKSTINSSVSAETAPTDNTDIIELIKYSAVVEHVKLNQTKLIAEKLV